MAELEITAGSVVPGTNPAYEDGTAGATITAGQALYKDASDSNKWKLADTNASATLANCRGIATHGASSGQPIKVQTGGGVNLGATLAVGRIYVVGATAGSIAPQSDLATGWYTCILGIATTTSNMDIYIKAGGVAYA